jgi:hypothetical protein
MPAPAGRAAGLSFLFVTEHSEWLELSFRANEDCLLEPLTPRVL